jgi:triacylglycerol lipase
MWDVINFCLILILLIIILIVLITVLYFYYQIKSYVYDTVTKMVTAIPLFNAHEYDSHNFGDIDETKRLINNGEFHLEVARLCCSINMSSYNIHSEFEPRLPEEIRHLETIGDNCFIYKIRKSQILIISYRGTRTSDDVLTDLDSVQTEMSGYSSNILVHRGFYRLWLPQKDELKKLMKNNFGSEYSIIITGHSLGCASALLTSLLLSKNYKVKLYMFAPPRIGNHHLIAELDASVPDNYSIINIPDIVPSLPFITLPTTGNTWLYENFSNRYLIDLQMGYVSLNHRLDTYMCGLLGVEESSTKQECGAHIWKKMPILIR